MKKIFHKKITPLVPGEREGQKGEGDGGREAGLKSVGRFRALRPFLHAPDDFNGIFYSGGAKVPALFNNPTKTRLFLLSNNITLLFQKCLDRLI